jgi:hypothetical protein
MTKQNKKPVTASKPEFEDSPQLHGYLDCLPRNRHLRNSQSLLATLIR